MENIDSNFDTVFNEISSLDVLAPTVKPTIKPLRNRSEINFDSIEDFVLKSSEELINAGLDSIGEIRDLIVQGQNPDEIESLASLINSTTGAIEILNKNVLLKKKNESAKELKTIDIENRKDTNISNTTVNNTNVLVASRDEIFKRFLNDNTTEQIEIDSNEQITDIES